MVEPCRPLFEFLKGIGLVKGREYAITHDGKSKRVSPTHYVVIVRCLVTDLDSGENFTVDSSNLIGSKPCD
jgi:hypothetical protein